MYVRPRDFWYLLSPYSDPDPREEEWRARMALNAAAQLWSEGPAVFSPIVHGHPINQASQVGGCWQTWAGFDLAMIESTFCLGGIVLKLPDWWASVGLWREAERIDALGKELRCMEMVI